jgi:hypothetical protein
VSVRTSPVVALGVVLLTMIGIGTIFGDAIVAVVAPPRLESGGAAAPGPAPPPPAPAAGAALGVPGATSADAGGPAAPDGNS